MHYNFDKDLVDGENAEEEVMIILKEKYEAYNVCDRKDNKYDIRFSTPKTQDVTIEVKNDIGSRKTGNIAIEYYCRNKPSGIQTTVADYWVIKTCDEFFLIPTNKLKTLITRKEYKRTVNGGDDRLSKMYLFDRNIIKLHSKLL